MKGFLDFGDIYKHLLYLFNKVPNANRKYEGCESNQKAFE